MAIFTFFHDYEEIAQNTTFPKIPKNAKNGDFWEMPKNGQNWDILENGVFGRIPQKWPKSGYTPKCPKWPKMPKLGFLGNTPKMAIFSDDDSRSPWTFNVE